MKSIEHDALMEEMEKKKRQAIIMIAAIAVAFTLYYLFVRPILKAYI
ncbi:MAG: hypothetical protein KAW41_02495 [Candidatus Diapherotrites archaeon]|nr:hypothetical protein [Candidatus Diapherotrites archaeon]